MPEETGRWSARATMLALRAGNGFSAHYMPTCYIDGTSSQRFTADELEKFLIAFPKPMGCRARKQSECLVVTVSTIITAGHTTKREEARRRVYEYMASFIGLKYSPPFERTPVAVEGNAERIIGSLANVDAWWRQYYVENVSFGFRSETPHVETQLLTLQVTGPADGVVTMRDR